MKTDAHRVFISIEKTWSVIGLIMLNAICQIFKEISCRTTYPKPTEALRVNNTNQKGQTSFSGVRRGFMPPQLKTNQKIIIY